MVSLPVIPTTGWHAFPSHDNPKLFNYGHVHYYALESIQRNNFTEESDHGLGHMNDKPMKNGRKYVDSGFVHDMMDILTAEHYLELPHNVVVVLSVNSAVALIFMLPVNFVGLPLWVVVVMWWPFCFLSLTTFKSTGRL